MLLFLSVMKCLFNCCQIFISKCCQILRSACKRDQNLNVYWNMLKNSSGSPDSNLQCQLTTNFIKAEVVMNTINAIKLKANADSGHQLQWNYPWKVKIASPNEPKLDSSDAANYYCFDWLNTFNSFQKRTAFSIFYQKHADKRRWLLKPANQHVTFLMLLRTNQAHCR